MHLISAMPGGWSPDEGAGVFHIQQTPGKIVFLSAGDTELLAMGNAYRDLQKQFPQDEVPSLRMANLTYFKQELTIDTYIEEVLDHAQVVVLRLLGGANYYPYLVESVEQIAREKGVQIVFLPGYDQPDLALMEKSTFALPFVDKLWKYFVAGGIQNLSKALYWVLHQSFGWEIIPEPPQEIPDQFYYGPEKGICEKEELLASLEAGKPSIAILSYRTHYLAENVRPVNSLIAHLQEKGVNPVPIFVHTLRDTSALHDLEQLLMLEKNCWVNAIINTTSFSIKNQSDEESSLIFERLQVPVIQAIQASLTYNAWDDGLFGLTPTDMAMNVTLPEMDGRIISRAISFKKIPERDNLTDSEVTWYEPHEQGIRFVTELAERWVNLGQKNNADKQIAIILPNYPGKDSRLANGVGLDTPESTVEFLKALKKAGYNTGEWLPEDNQDLMTRLTTNVTNEIESRLLKKYEVFLSLEDFYRFFNQLSPEIRKKVEDQWGKPEDDPYFNGERFALSGFLLQGEKGEGKIWVSLQPSRGYNVDEKASYHSPDLPPTYTYLAFYCWLSHTFQADAVVHMGKHGNLEWLPGKSIALDENNCFPAAIWNAFPHFYPFILNDPGEGAQAKRRNQAVIIDHLVPPMTLAETYGTLTQLEHLIDEYYEAFNLDTKRAKLIREKIQHLVKKENLENDLQVNSDDIDNLLMTLDGYLCELKESQIRYGLHTLGQKPVETSLGDFLATLHRLPGMGYPGLTQALATDLQIPIDPLNCNYADSWEKEVLNHYCRTQGDVVEVLEKYVKETLDGSLKGNNVSDVHKYPEFQKVINYLLQYTLPKVERTSEEIRNLLEGLNGKYVPAGPSGAPTRGRLDVLPSGRNFYSVDVRTVPTESAYELGSKSAEAMVERYMQENGDYPTSIGISVWGTATMRTGGDDLAQALALLGVKPVWQNSNRRVNDFEVIPLMKLGRPRVDVTLRISGFFRDAFPDLITLFNAAVEKVAYQDEDLNENPVKARYLKEKESWQKEGLSEEQAEERSLYRVFGSKPGAYGAGLQGLIDGKNWENSHDLARAYINWSGFAYTKKGYGKSAHEVYKQRLGSIDVVMQNQDNREHDILDSDDYYQFHGGMTNAVQTEKGEQPTVYFGDHSKPENPKVKSLQEELLKVYRSRAINPKWIEGVKKHGYKGVFELAATMDYLFAYDATTNMVHDFMYEGMTRAYLLDDENREFIEQNNPWALRDMSERMLEAIQRGMWKNPSQETQDQLREIYLHSDELMEGQSE